MQEILVVQDIGLWIDLNRHFAGTRSVELIESPSVETGKALAALESVSIVVFGSQSGAEVARALLQDLRDHGRCGTHVIHVDPRSDTPPQAVALDTSQLVVCSPDRLTDVVSGILLLSEPPREEYFELLAQYEAHGAEQDSGFVVILDLSEDQILLQSDHHLPDGTTIDFNFFLPDPDGPDARLAVSVTGTIDRCCDELAMIYNATISELPPAACRAVKQLDRGRPQALTP